MTVSTGPTAPVEEPRVAVATPLRLALLHGRDDASGRLLMHAGLASAGEIVVRIRALEGGSLVDAAQALRDARPDVVFVHGASADERALADLLEALRLGCGPQRPAPRVVAIAESGLVAALERHASPFEFSAFASATELVGMVRDQRRASGDVMRDTLIEDAARALCATTGAPALAVDVSDRSTSLVLARPDGPTDAVHVASLGIGSAADRVAASAGLDNVRRWLPWGIDAPALLERIWNRARGGGDAGALLLDMAIAREAIAHALRAGGEAGADVEAMRAATAILVTGKVAAFARPAETLLALVDGLQPTSVTTVYREPDEGGAARIAMVVPLVSRRPTKVRLVRAGGRTDEKVAPGTLRLVPDNGDVSATATGGGARGHGRTGMLGILIDARGRPLELPERDGDRIPTVARWHAALGLGGQA